MAVSKLIETRNLNENEKQMKDFQKTTRAANVTMLLKDGKISRHALFGVFFICLLQLCGGSWFSVWQVKLKSVLF